MKDFSLFKKKILFVFPLIYAPGPAASVWNVFGKSSKPALIVQGDYGRLREDCPTTGAPGPDKEVGPECGGPQLVEGPTSEIVWPLPCGLLWKLHLCVLWLRFNLDLVQ